MATVLTLPLLRVLLAPTISRMILLALVPLVRVRQQTAAMVIRHATTLTAVALALPLHLALLERTI
jgi:hypothetical protein